MKLQGIDYGNVLVASGAQGFFGEGYWFHKLFGPFGPNFKGTTFVSKTATWLAREGNMPLNEHYGPEDFFPDCVKANFRTGVMLNAVGLSNPGFRTLLEEDRWQRRTKPFFISIMLMGDTWESRRRELLDIVSTLYVNKPRFQAPFGLQINLSCPNTTHDPREMIKETGAVLEIASSVGVPLMPKYSIASAPVQAVMELEQNPYCDAICVSNTLPYNWKGVGQRCWNQEISPLAHLGGGGISGPHLCPFVCDWILRLRNLGFTKPINGGGGIFKKQDVDAYRAAGASSIFLGTVATLRPWRVKKLTAYANSLDWRN